MPGGQPSVNPSAKEFTPSVNPAAKPFTPTVNPSAKPFTPTAKPFVPTNTVTGTIESGDAHSSNVSSYDQSTSTSTATSGSVNPTAKSFDPSAHEFVPPSLTSNAPAFIPNVGSSYAGQEYTSFDPTTTASGDYEDYEDYGNGNQSLRKPKVDPYDVYSWRWDNGAWGWETSASDEEKLEYVTTSKNYTAGEYFKRPKMLFLFCFFACLFFFFVSCLYAVFWGSLNV